MTKFRFLNNNEFKYDCNFKYLENFIKYIYYLNIYKFNFKL